MTNKAALTILLQARAGDLSAQVSAGMLYLEGGDGIRRDPQAAFYWLRAAAARGSSEAQRLIGSAIPESSVQRPETVVQYYESASKAGSPNADLALSDWLLSGGIAQGGQARACELLERAARAGDRKAQLRLAMLLRSGSLGEGREDEALRWFEKAAALGSGAASLALADWHWERNDPAALRWLDKLAAPADAEHLYRSAVLLCGQGRTAQAARLFEKAARLDHPGAQLHYGLLHSAPGGRKRTGVPHSLKKTAFWLEKASRSGNVQASFELYRLFRRREFSLKDAAMARRFLETAAEQGHAHAQFLIGHLWLRDKVSHNADISAAKWFLRASKQKHAEAGAVVRLLYRRPATSFPAAGMEPVRLIRLMARSRLALAMRLELAAAFSLSTPETLLFDSASADHDECMVVDIRRFAPRTKRRLIVVQSEDERALLDRAKRLLSATNPHPSDVRGPYLRRKLDFEHTLTLLGARAAEPERQERELHLAT